MNAIKESQSSNILSTHTIMNKLYRIILFVSTVSFMISGKTAMAQWNADPTVNTPVCTTPVSSQYFPQLAPDGAGGAFVVWMETVDLNTSQIYAQHLSADGIRLWAAAGIPVTPGIGVYTQPQITSDGDGGAIISWIDLAGSTIKHYVQKISSTGQLQWNSNGVAVCPAEVTQMFFYQLLADGKKGAILVWNDGRNGPNEVFAQRIGPDGTLQWPVTGVACTPPFTNYSSYEAVTDSTGGMIMCWTLTTGIATRNDVYVQHINGEGVAQWGPQGINICSAIKDQLYCKIVKDIGENVIVIWQDFRLDPDRSQLYGQRISADGNPLWDPGGVLLADSVVATSTIAKIVTDTKGGVQLAWIDKFLPLPSDSAHLLRVHVDSMGTIVDAKKEIATWHDLQMPVDFEFVPDFKGGSFISWAQPTPNIIGNAYEIYDIYAQHLLADGNTEFPVSGQAVSTAPMTQYYHQMVCDSNGVATLAWSDIRNGADFDLYASTLSIQAVVPVTWLSFSGSVVQSGVLLKWETADEINNKGFIIQRSADGIHFDSIGFKPTSNAPGKSSYTFTDNHPLQGSGFYRLNQADIDGRTEYSRIIRVNIGREDILSLYPNPASGHIILEGNIANSIICIYGSDGRKIKEIRNSSLELIKIDISRLIAGSYYVIITNADDRKVRSVKFIKL
jgi:hypothetical protein